MSAEQSTNKEIALVANGIQLFQTVPGIVAANQQSVQRAKMAVDNFLNTVNANGGKLGGKTDEQAKELIIKVKATVKKMNDQRKPFTQIMGEITKMFTTLEKEVEGMAEKIQPLRDNWAKALIEAEQQKRIEAERKAAIQLQKDQLKGWCIGEIQKRLSDYLFSRKSRWQYKFNEITLENFEKYSEALKKAEWRVGPVEVSAILTDFPLPSYPLLSTEDCILIKKQTLDDYDLLAFYNDASKELREIKQSLIDKLPSLKSDLEEQALASEAEKVALEAKKREREEAEKARLALEKAEADQRAKEAAEMATAQAQAATLFEQAIESAPETSAPESRQSFDIQVKHPAGWVEIFQLWYQKEGVHLSVDDAGKKTLNQMKAFCEKHAKDTGEKIDSKFLVYEISVKAVNRKMK